MTSWLISMSRMPLRSSGESCWPCAMRDLTAASMRYCGMLVAVHLARASLCAAATIGATQRGGRAAATRVVRFIDRSLSVIRSDFARARTPSMRERMYFLAHERPQRVVDHAVPRLQRLAREALARRRSAR